MPNYIRVKQINPNELSGFFVDSISSQSGLLLAFASGAASGAASGIILNETVLLTGNQNISGNKTFLNNLNVSGDLTIAGTLRYNEIIDTTVTGSISGYTGIFSQVYANNLVYNTGDQTISGNKTFATQIIASNLIYNTGNQTISGDKTFEDNINISGDLTLNGGLYINDIEELNLAGAKIYADNLVYNTGNQTISGLKTFAQTGSFNTLQITNKKLSSYNYSTSNFIFGDNYVNLINSSTNITGTLPSEITSGINYYIKNLNTGILLITGSGQRTIDGFSTVNLYKNESLQLVGVNNVGYTGWVTISADNGVS